MRASRSIGRPAPSPGDDEPVAPPRGPPGPDRGRLPPRGELPPPVRAPLLPPEPAVERPPHRVPRDRAPRVHGRGPAPVPRGPVLRDRVRDPRARPVPDPARARAVGAAGRGRA